jgi:hypothetical protein
MWNFVGHVKGKVESVRDQGAKENVRYKKDDKRCIMRSPISLFFVRYYLI